MVRQADRSDGADVRAGIEKAAAAAEIKTIIPVGEAWTRAMQTGVADPNPYDGIEAGKLDLWTYDHYHASTAGYYLEGPGRVRDHYRRDPRSLGDNECSGYELGLARPQVKALQQVAFDELAAAGLAKPAALATAAVTLSKPNISWRGTCRGQPNSPLTWIGVESICKPS